MIPISRQPEPGILTENSPIWAADLCEELRRWYADCAARKKRGDTSKPPRKPDALRSHYAHDDVKTALREMFRSKCAYCESNVTVVSYQHVEHFRPKSVYPALAYEWQNLLFACERCNSAYKKTHFPLAPHGRTLTEDRRRPCSRNASDNALLINPCDENPAQFLTFRNARVVALNHRGKRTRDICGLNREDLVDARRKHLKMAQAIISAYLEAKQSGQILLEHKYRRALVSLLRDTAPYTGMVRTEVALHGINLTIWVHRISVSS